MMVDVSTIALSGFAASEKRIAVVANNVANANTPNFRAQDVQQTSIASGGVSTQVVAANPPPPAPVQGKEQSQASDVQLDQELVKADVATYSAQANLKVLKVADQLNKYLLDIQA